MALIRIVIYSLAFKSLLLFLLGAAALVDSKLIVQTSNGTESYYAPTLIFSGSTVRTVIPMQGELALENHVANLSSPARFDTFAGKIVFIHAWEEWSEHEIVSWLPLAAAKAALLVIPYGPDDSSLGYPEFSIPSTYNITISCPAVTVPWSVGDRLVQLVNAAANESAGPIVIRIDGDDGQTTVRGWLFSWWFWILSIGSAFFHAAVCGVAVVKIIEYYRNIYSGRHSVMAMCIYLEFYGAADRFLYWAIDAMGARQLISPQGGMTWRTSNVPFSLASTLLLTFYWYESLSRTSLKISLQVDKFRIPCYMLIFLSFAVEIVFDAVRMVKQDLFSIVRQMNAIVYFFIALGMSIFYIYTATKIFVALRRSDRSKASASKMSTNTSSVNSDRSSSSESSRLRSIKSITIKLLAAGIFGLALCAVAPASLAPALARAPMISVGYILYWIITHLLLNLRALSTLLAFETGASRSITSRTRSGSKK